jgi:hypothetical protein
MRNGKQENGEEVFPYGLDVDPGLQEKQAKKILTILNGNPNLATRLTSSLGLKDTPGQPPIADMSKVSIIADMFQQGFANFRHIGQTGVSTGAAAIAGKRFIGGTLIGPSDSIDPNLAALQTNPLFLFAPSIARPLIRNTDFDCRVTNGYISYNPAVLNPQADTNPESLRVFFYLDGCPVFIATQNNLVSSAADYEFFFQTADSTWDGIVSAGLYLSWLMVKSNGLTGATKTFDPFDIWTAGVCALAVPVGAQIPR